jgi:hypothetical protein
MTQCCWVGHCQCFAGDATFIRVKHFINTPDTQLSEYTVAKPKKNTRCSFALAEITQYNNVLRQEQNCTWFTSEHYISVYNLCAPGQVLQLTDCVVTYRSHVSFTEKFSVHVMLVCIPGRRMYSAALSTK